MEKEEILRMQLAKLDKEHSELDSIIENMLGEQIVNQIAVQRLKKQKLLLRDQMSRIRSQMCPNVIA